MEYKEIGQHINLIAICISAFKCYRKHWEISEGLIFGFAIWLALNSIKWFWFDISEKFFFIMIFCLIYFYWTVIRNWYGNFEFTSYSNIDYLDE